MFFYLFSTNQSCVLLESIILHFSLTDSQNLTEEEAGREGGRDGKGGKSLFVVGLLGCWLSLSLSLSLSSVVCDDDRGICWKSILLVGRSGRY